jgi:hypothetical protein
MLIQSKDLEVYELWLSLFCKGRHAWLSYVRRENEHSEQEKIPRTLPLVLRRKRHMEQPTFGPQSLRQILLIR